MMLLVEVTSSLAISPSTLTTTHYKYFAIGSNMVPSTMTSLRNLAPLSATAAILPNYELRFNIPGNSFIEPSAASVQQRIPLATTDEIYETGFCVHGVLYTLTEDDFVKLGRSEGVPFAYIWERCFPIPYIGNNQNAGHEALLLQQQQQQQQLEPVASQTAEAFVLTANPLFASSKSNPKNIPPSNSYLQILKDGAKYWKMDETYRMYLQNDIATDPIIPGISKQLLQLAERMNPKPDMFLPQ